MIDFLVTKNNPNLNSSFEKNELLLNGYVLYCNQIDYIFINGDSKLIIIGDCLNVQDFDLSIDNIRNLLHLLKGNFYVFLIKGEEMYFSSSSFGLLPIYYLNDYSFFSSSVELIKKISKIPLTKNKKWIINQLLFNFQFGNDTFFEEIKLFPTLSYLQIKDNKREFIEYYKVRDEFTKYPIPWRKALPDLSNKFIEITEEYIPEKNAIISFTGGFDGRTIVSIATHFKKKITTFSYGKIENDDVHIPLKNAKKLGVKYFWIDLDNKYVEKEYWISAKNYIKSTNGGNGFLYAHVDYSANILKEKSIYLLSGICGSELFRAAHSSGAVTSKALLDLFKYDDYDSFKKEIFNSNSLSLIDKSFYHEEINETINEAWNYKNTLPETLTKNQKLYVYVYEEIFRKFFGAWVKSQMEYMKVRTPYIDFDFVKKIIKTELSGAYSDFLTENPIKRYKGQVFYTEVIRKTNKNLFWTKTGKGYAPAIVNIPLLRPLLIIPFLSKRIKRKMKKINFDYLGIISGIKSNLSVLKKMVIKDDIIKKELISKSEVLDDYSKEAERDNILSLWSIIYYENYFKNGKK